MSDSFLLSPRPPSPSAINCTSALAEPVPGQALVTCVGHLSMLVVVVIIVIVSYIKVFLVPSTHGALGRQRNVRRKRQP